MKTIDITERERIQLVIAARRMIEEQDEAGLRVSKSLRSAFEKLRSRKQSKGE